MGECYAKELEATLSRTRRRIVLGRIKTDDELKFYLTDLAATLVRFRDLALVINDLLIEARQTGLYALIVQVHGRSGCGLQTRSTLAVRYEVSMQQKMFAPPLVITPELQAYRDGFYMAHNRDADLRTQSPGIELLSNPDRKQIIVLANYCLNKLDLANRARFAPEGEAACE